MEKRFSLEQTDREEGLVNSDFSCKIENISKFKFRLKDKKVVVDQYLLFLEGKSISSENNFTKVELTQEEDNFTKVELTELLEGDNNEPEGDNFVSKD